MALLVLSDACSSHTPALLQLDRLLSVLPLHTLQVCH